MRTSGLRSTAITVVMPAVQVTETSVPFGAGFWFTVAALAQPGMRIITFIARRHVEGSVTEMLAVSPNGYEVVVSIVPPPESAADAGTRIATTIVSLALALAGTT